MIDSIKKTSIGSWFQDTYQGQQTWTYSKSLNNPQNNQSWKRL